MALRDLIRIGVGKTEVSANFVINHTGGGYILKGTYPDHPWGITTVFCNSSPDVNNLTPLLLLLAVVMALYLFITRARKRAG